MINEIRNDIKLVESLEVRVSVYMERKKQYYGQMVSFYIASGNSTNTYLTLWDSENKNVGLLIPHELIKKVKKHIKKKIRLI